MAKKNRTIIAAILFCACVALLYIAVKMSTGKPWGIRQVAHP
jgi:hypothetical protein